MRSMTRVLALIAALGVLAGCVAPALNTTQTAELATEANFLKFAGPPIESFTWLGRYDGFRTLGDKAVVIFTMINDGYLIRVLDPCINLRFANKVGLTSTTRTVNRHFDMVLVDQERCRIDTIQHIDYGALKRARLAGP